MKEACVLISTDTFITLTRILDNIIYTLDLSSSFFCEKNAVPQLFELSSRDLKLEL